jgi:hypothetical protein
METELFTQFRILHKRLLERLTFYQEQRLDVDGFKTKDHCIRDGVHGSWRDESLCDFLVQDKGTFDIGLELGGGGGGSECYASCGNQLLRQLQRANLRRTLEFSVDSVWIQFLGYSIYEFANSAELRKKIMN